MTAPDDRPEETDALESRSLVTEQAVRERRTRSQYIHDPKIPGGALKGVCYVKYGKRVRLYPPLPIEPEGDNAIRDPRNGEVAYFRARQPRPIVYFGRYAQAEQRYGVHGAVVAIRDVQAGRRGDFDRLRYQVDFRTQQIVPAKPEGRDVFNPSAYGVGLMRVKQLVQVLNLTLYDCDLALTDTATGEVVWQGAVRRYHDPNFPGDHLGSNPVMKRPTVYQIPRIEKKGMYVLSCKRHPWHRAYLVLWDSPYITVSTGDADAQHRYPDRAGQFAFEGVPEGAYTVEVWHPLLEPVKRTHRVEISVDRITPLSVEFKALPALEAAPVPLPNTAIEEWAFVGPFFPLMDEEPDAPNNNLDFSATYDGMEEEVAWKRVRAGSDRNRGYVLLDAAMGRLSDLCLSYYAVHVDSPKAQKLYLQVHNEAEALKIWLDGKVIFRSYTGDFGAPGRLAGPFVVTGELKAGRNTLLLLVSTERTDRARFCVKYRAENADVKVPVK